MYIMYTTNLLCMYVPCFQFLLQYVEEGKYVELKEHISPKTKSGFEKLYSTMLYFLRLTAGNTKALKELKI